VPLSRRLSIANTPQAVPDFDVETGPDTTKGVPRVLYLSNLIPEKGAAVFLRLALAFLQSGGQAQFDIVGANGDALFARDLREKINTSGYESSISLRGAADSAEKWAFLRSATVLVFPSTYEFEAQPLTLIEALAAGTPSIAFDVGGIADVVRDGVTGFAVTNGDFDALYERFISVLLNPQLRNDLSRGAIETFESQFSHERFVSRWLDLISQHADDGVNS
jgi:glycosyltransferase involved in cell wall biosynthesis